MAQLKQGADVCPSNNDAIIDSVIPIPVNASTVLIPFTHRYITVDPTAGQVIHLLPDAITSLGVFFHMKRLGLNAPNAARLRATGGDSIQGTTDFILGNVNEYVEIYSDGTDEWKVSRQRSTGAAALVDSAPTSQNTSATPVPVEFDIDAFTTPERCIAVAASDKITVIEILAVAGTDVYNVSFLATFQAGNNIDGRFNVYVGGVATALGASFTGNGANDLSVAFEGIVPIVGPGPVDVEVRVETASATTVDFDAGTQFTMTRIGG